MKTIMNLKTKLAIWWRGPDWNLENTGKGYHGLHPDPFPEANVLLGPPPGMEETCRSLAVHRDHNGVTSCWKVPFRERLKLLLHGRVWLNCVGTTMPPVWVVVGKTILKEAPEELN